MKLALIAAAAIPAQTANSIQTMKMAQAFAGLGHSVRVFVRGEDPGLSWKEIAHHYGLTRRHGDAFDSNLNASNNASVSCGLPTLMRI